MGQERTGQLFSLALENDIHEAAVDMHEVYHERITGLDNQLQSKNLTGAERAAVVAEHAVVERRALLLGAYCASQGLIEVEQVA